MYWRVTSEEVSGGARESREFADGSFVLHRHRDADGPHLDLRIECGDCLMGWRIDACTFDGEPWATEKAPHDRRWLEQHGDAECVDAGLYRWAEQRPDARALLLMGRNADRMIRIERAEGLNPSTVRAVRDALSACNVEAAHAAQLITDGVTARTRAIERVCGLGRELDGSAFDDGLWRRTLAQLSLDEIHVHLRALELRFDAKYPPSPVSRPEPLPSREAGRHAERALTILREDARV
ncbi:MAG: hypothetical protein IT364_16040 [Candidatus Hydrogenedentes bacterium]|nr:hypothetical protein [Candidatus Hydrogenedentota bacterium]